MLNPGPSAMGLANVLPATARAASFAVMCLKVTSARAGAAARMAAPTIAIPNLIILAFLSVFAAGGGPMVHHLIAPDHDIMAVEIDGRVAMRGDTDHRLANTHPLAFCQSHAAIFIAKDRIAGAFGAIGDQ